MDYSKSNIKKFNDSHFLNSLIDFSPLYFLSIWRDIPINQLSSHVSPKVISDLSKKFRYLVEITKFPYQCVLSSTYYLYMLSKKHPELKGYGSERNLMVMALMVTNKMLYDNTYSNKTWSEISDIPLDELNIMELEFCGVLDYNLNIDPKNYGIWENYMRTLVAKFESDSVRRLNNLKTSRAFIQEKLNTRQKINNPPSPVTPITPVDEYSSINRSRKHSLY
ncbi:hypothetical protein H8356DRAFT_1625805 [Neocallimastix lanati (nom. inval.)]|uniref:Cyclin N-terminal domain-containing protein n=1 Tax=Neocallimastix californiae TaxID=1754190 RepID=A0A1Y2AEM1_9FUNG|nr:hypothetical protein H8356DRAFT_1625805 [Neocallimastix sp. JGI-2020a]ORY21028.1 hypothetical protein LY90DRAFT_676465 [Neocallimastix californiae]|eukprot:ORY21028.1 hypothetical protein LY90DRAFT_676465 [Neocallimastix californiae]